jgi:rare lipoprotein A
MNALMPGSRLAGLTGVAALLVALHGPASAQEAASPQAEAVEATQAHELGRGRATWYGPRFHGRRTSSGERFDMNRLTAAHPTLPFGTRVRVRNEANGREVVVRINDRAPRLPGRIIDLSKAAAAALGFLKAGKAPVVLFER